MEAASRMEILVGSDLHNDGQALEWFCGLAETHRPDVVVFLGDFITGEPIRFLKEALASIRELADHVLVVPGNHDPRQALVELDIAAFDGLKHLHKQSTEIYGLSFAGLGGSVVTPKGDGELEFADEGFSGLLAPQLPADVWVLHCPLHSILDQNSPEVMLGSKRFSTFGRRKRSRPGWCYRAMPMMPVGRKSRAKPPLLTLGHSRTARQHLFQLTAKI